MMHEREEGELLDHEGHTVDAIGPDIVADALKMANSSGSNSACYNNMAQWLIEIENRLDKLEGESRMKKSKDVGRVISRNQLMEMILEAIQSTNGQFGCSRAFVRKYLFENHSVPNNIYYTRRINQVLLSAANDGVLKYDSVHQLFSMTAH